MSQQQQNEVAKELESLGYNFKRNIHRRFIVWKGVVGDVEIKKFVTIKAVRGFISELKDKNKSESA